MKINIYTEKSSWFNKFHDNFKTFLNSFNCEYHFHDKILEEHHGDVAFFLSYFNE
jgi:hypothetical protein